MTTNMYRVGDYVYFETAPSMPYQIRRIEELNKTSSGNVEAKVMCYFRRRDIPATLLSLADKHQEFVDGVVGETNGNNMVKPDASGSPAKAATSPTSSLDPATNEVEPVKVESETDAKVPSKKEEETCASVTETKPEITEKAEEKEPIDELNSKQKNQLNQRELFLSKQVEILPATNIRGKCTVTLLNETESFSSYIDKEDAFFYTLVYDPVQRTLLADRGEIRVGSRYQAEPTALLKEGHTDGRNMEELEVLTWTPEHGLSDREIDQFLVVARSVGTFARALDCSSSVKQPSLHMSAAAASRDITLFHAMDALHQSGYDLGKAMCALVPQTGPILCRDQMEEWSASEANLFEEAMEKYGKDFNDVRQDFLSWKVPSSLIEYYYLWKTTDRYVQQKRVKAVEAESKLKQVYIPTYNKPHPAAIGPPLPQSSKNGAHQIEIGLGPGKFCEFCSVATSVQWYAWSPANTASPAVPPQSRLCQACWSYWKKYGELTVSSKVALLASSDEESKNLSGGPEALTSRPHRCSNQGCGKTRTAFYLAVTPITRLARRFSAHLLRPRHAARFPFLPISAAAIRQDFQMRMARKTSAEVQSWMLRAQKPLAPIRPPKRIRVADLTFRLARGQIQPTTAAWLILPDRSLPKTKLNREAFPKPPKASDGSLIYDKIVLPQRETDRLKRRPDDSPLEGPPFKRSARESPSNVVSPLSVLAPLSGLAMGISGSPTPVAASPFLPNLSSIASLPISSLRPNIPSELYVSALANSSGLVPLLPGSKGSPSPSSAISPTVKPSLLPSVPQSLTAPNLLAGRGARSHGSRGGLHGHSGGRIKQLPTWMDAPDDLFFHSTQITKKLRRQLATQELRRAARKPWRPLTPRKA
ncbi:putative Metastasis-associated protein MTA1 [Daphnia magna]|uniref:Putative Metastasis-associated protein MTA1 n=1 Tax=Daphnia magna TaxID=35525 RepID=A0A0P5UUK1_9CRUS|nr:putative Metastasis-associated protein MTA1 [Daphnia magna]